MTVSSIIAGLGNPGAIYENTRHNFGFNIIDALQKKLEQEHIGFLQATTNLKQNVVCRFHLKDQVFLFAKPLTYMNLSGESLAALLKFYQLQPQNLIVIHDELDLNLGHIQLKFGGGTAGHNGLKSITSCLGSKEFLRLRLGIGKPDYDDIANYVLHKFNFDELPIVSKVTDKACEIILAYFNDQLNLNDKKTINFRISN